MVETIVLSMLLAKIKRLRILPLFKGWGVYPLALFVIAYVLLEVLLFNGFYGILRYQYLFKTFTLIMVLILGLYFRLYLQNIIGATCVIIGTVLNNIAIHFNDGKMPVFPTLSRLTGYLKFGSENSWMPYDFHIIGDAGTRFKLLTDIFDLGYSVMSIGDIFVRAFTFIVVYYAIKQANINAGLLPVKDLNQESAA